MPILDQPLFAIESNLPIAGKGERHTLKEWNRIYGYDRSTMISGRFVQCQPESTFEVNRDQWADKKAAELKADEQVIRNRCDLAAIELGKGIAGLTLARDMLLYGGEGSGKTAIIDSLRAVKSALEVLP